MSTFDAIRIQFVRGCDAQGQGGNVVDDASGVLGSLPDGTPILDALAAAFADQWSLYQYEDAESKEVVTVSPIRNISVRMRLWATEILSAYASKIASQQAAALAREQTEAAIDALTVVTHVGG